MKYDFTSIIDRKDKDALAVEKIPVKNATIKEGYSRIPMWVADMNFQTAPSIVEAMQDRIKHPIYGYFTLSDQYYQSIIDWHMNKHQVVNMKKENIGYENGVLGGLISALSAICSPGDKVLIHAPTYIGFTASIENHGYKIILSPLILDEEGMWRMDYADMEEKLKEDHIHAAIICSPHNPTGRVWEREELEKAMEIYRRYDCRVISDEIWSDIVLDGSKHIPTQSISEDAKQRTVALYAPSKTFNLAGLVGSYHVVYNQYLNHRITKEASLSHYNTPNVLSMHALVGAYTKGASWLEELKQVLSENVNYAYSFINTHFKGLHLSKPQGTYMLFINCKDWCESHKISLDQLLERGISVGVIWQDGRPFHGEYCIRMNLALPHSQIKEAFQRLKNHVFQ